MDYKINIKILIFLKLMCGFAVMPMVSPKVLSNKGQQTDFENRHGVLWEIDLCCCSEMANGVRPWFRGRSPHSASRSEP